MTALVLARKVLADGFAQLGGSLDAVQELKQVIEAGAEQELEESNPPS